MPVLRIVAGFMQPYALAFVQADLVGDHRDELTIRGFAAEVVDSSKSL